MHYFKILKASALYIFALLFFQCHFVFCSSPADCSKAPALAQKMRNFKFEQSTRFECGFHKIISTVTNTDTQEFLTEEVRVSSNNFGKKVGDISSTEIYSSILLHPNKQAQYLMMLCARKSVLILAFGGAINGNMTWQRPATPDPSAEPSQSSRQ